MNALIIIITRLFAYKYLDASGYIKRVYHH